MLPETMMKGDVPSARLEQLEGGQGAEPRHAEVGQDHVPALRPDRRAERFGRLDPVPAGLIARLLEPMEHQLRVVLRIFDD